MSTLTITVDDEVLRRARIRALDEGTSVNAMLAEHLRRFAGGSNPQAVAISRLLDHARRVTELPEVKANARRRKGRRWRREDLYER